MRQARERTRAGEEEARAETPKEREMATNYLQVANVVYAADTTIPVYSQAVSMNGANAVQVDGVLVVTGASGLKVDIEGSNDLENWPASLASTTKATVGAFTVSATGIAWQYVRLRYLPQSSAANIFTAGISTSQN
jgi:hypothetical protein